VPKLTKLLGAVKEEDKKGISPVEITLRKTVGLRPSLRPWLGTLVALLKEGPP
jgi:hypothetical protein